MFVKLTGEVLNEANYIVFFTELATAINIFVEKKSVLCSTPNATCPVQPKLTQPVQGNTTLFDGNFSKN